MRLLCLAGLLLGGAGAQAFDAARPAAAWPDTFLTRIEALALLETLNAELLSHDSATLTLEQWCSLHRLAPEPRIVAERIPGEAKPATPQLRRDLRVGDAEPVRYRRVRLRCGAAVLSEADNWYVPARLTPAMNALLDTTDTPFGKAVQALHFQRRTVASTLLWRPLAEGWEMAAPPPGRPAAPLPVPPEVLQHRAILALPDGTPFSEVIETYTANVLAFPEPGRAD